LIPREYYFDNRQEERSRRPPGIINREKKPISPCPSNDGKMLIWNEQAGVSECPGCGYRTPKQRNTAVLESLGAVNIVTADGYGDKDGAANSTIKPIMRSKWKSRSGETVLKHKTASAVRGDRSIEEWLLEPEQHSTYLVDYKSTG